MQYIIDLLRKINHHLPPILNVQTGGKIIFWSFVCGPNHLLSESCVLICPRLIIQMTKDCISLIQVNSSQNSGSMATSGQKGLTLFYYDQQNYKLYVYFWNQSCWSRNTECENSTDMYWYRWCRGSSSAEILVPTEEQYKKLRTRLDNNKRKRKTIWRHVNICWTSIIFVHL